MDNKIIRINNITAILLIIKKYNTLIKLGDCFTNNEINCYKQLLNININRINNFIKNKDLLFDN